MNDIRDCYLPELPEHIENTSVEPGIVNGTTLKGRRNVLIVVITATITTVVMATYFYVQNQKLKSDVRINSH